MGLVMPQMQTYSKPKEKSWWESLLSTAMGGVGTGIGSALGGPFGGALGGALGGWAGNQVSPQEYDKGYLFETPQLGQQDRRRILQEWLGGNWGEV